MFSSAVPRNNAQTAGRDRRCKGRLRGCPLVVMGGRAGSGTGATLGCRGRAGCSARRRMKVPQSNPPRQLWQSRILDRRRMTSAECSRLTDVSPQATILGNINLDPDYRGGPVPLRDYRLPAMIGRMPAVVVPRRVRLTALVACRFRLATPIFLLIALRNHLVARIDRAHLRDRLARRRHHRRAGRATNNKEPSGRRLQRIRQLAIWLVQCSQMAIN